MTKKTALTHCRARASRTIGVVVERGPSSKVRTTSCESKGRGNGLPIRGVVFGSIASTRLVPSTPPSQSAALATDETKPKVKANAKEIRQAALHRLADERCDGMVKGSPGGHWRAVGLASCRPGREGGSIIRS